MPDTPQQAQLKTQTAPRRAPNVRQVRLQTLRGARRVIRALREPPVESELPSATTWRQQAARQALRRSVRAKRAPRAQRDSALTQRIQHASSARREAMQLPKGAFSASRAQQEDLAVQLGLRRAPLVQREPSQQLTARLRALRARARQSPHVLAQRTVLRVLAVRNRIKRGQSASNFS